MPFRRSRIRTACAILPITAFAVLALTGVASAKLTGVYTTLQQCPWTKPEVEHCVHFQTEGGEVVLAHKKVPIVNTVTLLGGTAGAAYKSPIAKLVAAKGGTTLTEASQPVPGGLFGIVSPDNASPLVSAALALFLERVHRR